MRVLLLASTAFVVVLIAAETVGATPTRVDVSGAYAVTDFRTFSTTNFEQLIDCKTGRTHGHGTETFTGSVTGVSSGP